MIETMPLPWRIRAHVRFCRVSALASAAPNERRMWARRYIEAKRRLSAAVSEGTSA